MTIIGQTSSDIQSTDQSPRKGELISEHVMAAFARLNINPVQATVRNCEIKDLSDSAMPCVVILQHHTGIALVKALGKGRFEALTKQGQCVITQNDFASRYKGHVLTRAQPGETPVVEKVRPPEPEPEKPFIKKPEQPIVKQPSMELPEAETVSQNASPPSGKAQSAADSALAGGVGNDVRIGAAALARYILTAVLRVRAFKLMMISAMTANLFVFALPVYSMAVYDRIIPHHATETLVALTFGILIVLGVDLFCRNVRAQLQEAIGLRASLDMQWVLFQRVLKADFVHAPRSASIIQSAFGAVESACLITPALIVGVLVDVPFLLLTLIYTAFIAQWVVIAPLLTIIAVVAINLIAHLRARKSYIASSKGLIERQNLLEETVQGLGALKTAGAEPQVAERYRGMIDDMSYAGYEGRHEMSKAGLIANTILQLCTVASLVIGVFQINAGTLTVGALVAAVLLSSRAISPITMLAAQAVRAASLSSSLHYAAQLNNLPQEEGGDAQGTPTKLTGRVRLASVTLRYPNEPSSALQDVNFSISAGERVGIIGRIGCGKSTLLHMLPRLLTPETGTILLDEHDIRQFDPAWLRRQIAFMPQDCELIEGTIRDNILRGLSHVNEAQFREAARISGVMDIVAAHPKGYALEVGRRFRQLSGGERQAVCLARALVRDAPVLVMDEPTSAMDNQLEALVVNRMRDYVKGRTVIIATHRAPLLSLVDRVIWLENGRVVADGPREEVTARVSRRAA